MPMDLRSFMVRVGATLETVQQGTGLHASTISRIRAGKTNPTLDALQRIQRWADEEAVRLKLGPRDRLDDLAATLVPHRAHAQEPAA